MNIDWQVEANKAVEYTSRTKLGQWHFEAHRGAVPWKGVTAIFGNDAVNRTETQATIATMQDELKAAGIQELAFATDDKEKPYSWVLLVADDKASVWHDMHWQAHCRVFGVSGNGGLQRGIADRVVEQMTQEA